MAIALTLTVKDYILEDDKKLPKEKQTVFKLQPLSAKQFMEFQDQYKYEGFGEEIRPLNVNTVSHEVLKVSLIGWTNLKTIDGKEVKFIKDDMESNLDKLQYGDRLELFNEIMALSQLSAEKSKN